MIDPKDLEQISVHANVLRIRMGELEMLRKMQSTMAKDSSNQNAQKTISDLIAAKEHMLDEEERGLLDIFRKYVCLEEPDEDDCLDEPDEDDDI